MTTAPGPEASAEGAVRGEREGHVLLLTLDRPAKLNALTPAMTAQLADAVREANADDAVRAVVVTGAGRAFCAGSDIAGLDGYATAWEFGERTDYGDILRTLKKPAVAAVNGHALGGGLELALSCDIRLAAVGATFAAPEIKLGWIGGSGQSALLAHSIGAGNASWMVLTGDPVDTDTALAWGLVSKVTEPGALLDEARDLAARIAARAPLAARTAKRTLRAAHTMALDDAIALERHLQTVCFATEDAAEGRAAFAERRTPEFRGR
ncbi:enoyl-CoA hydratase/isomerase family protein [Streptomyces sp. NPDC050560]|uniref:enoyl-CoA hydratase/isomerase family protein n=1 Tax=Streptomyces sp. NPDC050560 TaxID=3365630 RepID=UPI0037A4541E